MRKPWVIVSLSLIGLITVLLCWPAASYDLARVHPSLRDLPRPYRAVRVESYLDGGSIGVEIVGADGTVQQFAFPVHGRPGQQPDYPQMFVGGKSIQRRPGQAPLTEITDSPDTRAMLIGLIDDEAKHDAERCIALVGLRGALGDYVKAGVFTVWWEMTP